MRKVHFLVVLTSLLLAFAGCNDKKTNRMVPEYNVQDSAWVEDTTVYGRCGEGTAMHTLELITDDGDTVSYLLGGADDEADVQGGLLAGDRLAVIAGINAEGEDVAFKVLNLTTLQGKWTSISRQFEIQEGGAVVSDVNERHPYTEWKIVNGKLVLSSDTFEVYSLGPDSLLLENDKGIFAYKRFLGQKTK